MRRLKQRPIFQSLGILLLHLGKLGLCSKLVYEFGALRGLMSSLQPFERQLNTGISLLFRQTDLVAGVWIGNI